MAASSNSIEALRKQLQQVQLGKVNKSLSERNCIELVSFCLSCICFSFVDLFIFDQQVSKLVERGLVNVIYTQDGREYVTFERLQSEILEELERHGGRINLVDLVSLLGVDLPCVESAVRRLSLH
jgi:hypothetical protein